MQNGLVFKSEHRARFEEMDPNGHLNSSRYLDYFSENRHEGHRELFSQSLFDLAKLSFQLQVRSVQVDYQFPIFLDEKFSIESFVDSFGESTALVKFKMQNSRGKISSTAEMTVICVSKSDGKPMAWPSEFKDQFFPKS